jgi:hypothetical protein
MAMSDQDKKTPEEAKENWEPDRDIIYYYSREHRLEKASKSVREYNNSPGLSPSAKAFRKNKGNVLTLVAILLISAMIMIYAFFSGSSGASLTLGNNSVILNIVEEESVLVLSVEKNVPNGKEAYTGAVDVAVSPILPEGEEIPVFAHRIFFSMNSPEVYYMVLPFVSERIMIILQTEYETIARTIRR